MASVIENFPDISFIDNEQLEEVLNKMISDYQEKYKEITGKEISLSRADPYRLILNACALQIYQAMQYADYAGKMSFLKYANGNYLDNLAALRGAQRISAAPAECTVQFSMSAAQAFVVSIEEGTRVTNGNGVFFATQETVEIPVGSTSITVKAICTETGVRGNGFAPGELNILVETHPYVTAVTNTTTTDGGAETESDDALRDRIFVGSSAYSTAGPAAAYEYFVKKADATISDVVVYSSEPGEVDIVFTVNGNQIPSQALIDKVEDYLMDNDVRPLTDNVVVNAPSESTYNVNFTYYISKSDASAVTSIQNAVAEAVAGYNAWQTEKIGRDINPSYLIQKVMEAGAKRVEVTSPTRTVLTATTLAKLGTQTITYGGLEDD